MNNELNGTIPSEIGTLTNLGESQRHVSFIDCCSYSHGYHIVYVAAYSYFTIGNQQS